MPALASYPAFDPGCVHEVRERRYDSEAKVRHEMDSVRIETTPGICGGKPRIAGHRVRVMDVAALHEGLGLSAEEIAATYSGLTLAEVEAALAYYAQHRDEIQEDLARAHRLVEDLKRKNPSLLQQKLRQTGGK